MFCLAADMTCASRAGVSVSLTLVNVVVIIQGLPAVSEPAVSSSPSPVPVLPTDDSSASTKAAGGVLALGKLLTRFQFDPQACHNAACHLPVQFNP